LINPKSDLTPRFRGLIPWWHHRRRRQPTAHPTRRLCVSCPGNFSIGENGLFCIGCVLTMEAPIARAVALWHEVGGYATSRLGVS